MDVNDANKDIRFIKDILNKTQFDISKTWLFFVFIGVVNFLNIMAKEAGYYILNSAVNISKLAWYVLRSADWVAFLIISVAYFFFFIELRKTGNDLSKSLLKMWGCLILGSKIIIKVFCYFLEDGYVGLNESFVRVTEKFIYFILIEFGFLTMGILVHDIKLICGITLFAALYLGSLIGRFAIKVGTIHGNDVIISAQDLVMSVLLSLGMILCGFYLRHRRTNKGGDQ